MCIFGRWQNCEISKFSFLVFVFQILSGFSPLRGFSSHRSPHPHPPASPHRAHTHPVRSWERICHSCTLRKISQSLAPRIRPSPPPLPEDMQGNEALKIFLSSSFLGHGCVLEIRWNVSPLSKKNAQMHIQTQQFLHNFRRFTEPLKRKMEILKSASAGSLPDFLWGAWDGWGAGAEIWAFCQYHFIPLSFPTHQASSGAMFKNWY